jgi:hypothetical protein
MLGRSLVAAFVAVGFALGCGGGIKHNGYKRPDARPWKKPKVLEFDEDNEAEIDGLLSYPKKKRARWFAVDLPEFGQLSVRLNQTALVEDADWDVAYEVLDQNYVVLTAADNEEDDAGDEKKTRDLIELDGGRYFIHVYLQDRPASAEFTLRLNYKRSAPIFESEFPANVAYIGLLPQVPPIDDSPPPVIVKKCKKKNCRKPKPQPKTGGKSIKARIAGITSSPKGTRIKINRGSNDGIAVGWKGSVVTSSGARIPNGGFTVSKVSPSESFAAVRATTDAVTSAKYVKLRAP